MRRGFLSTYTGILILINVVVYILSIIAFNIIGDKFLDLFALTPNLFFTKGYFWTAFTSMFLHSGFFGGSIFSIHLLANMISLFFVGMFAEQIVGKKRFLGIYIASGIFASVFYATLSYFFGNSALGASLFGAPTTVALGASGAIFGLVGLIAVLTPRNRIYLIAGPLIAIIVQSILSVVITNSSIISLLDIVVTVYFIFSIFSMFSFNPKLRRFALPLEMPFWILPIVAIVPLIIVGLFISLPIGNTAHLGGLIAGVVYGFYLKKKYPRKTKMIDKYFSR